jgi:transcriptional regulator GlxA family with amidase domain
MTSPTESTHEFFTIYIPREGFERFAREAGLGGSPGWKVSALSSEPLAEAIRQLHALLLSGAGAACVEAAYSAALGALMASAGRSAQSRTSGAAHRGVRRAMKRLSADLSESLSLVDLASEAQMSKCHLVRCFQQALGVPPHRYRMLLRLQCARRLLEQGSSVGEVADRTGFADAPHLTRAFRDWLGASPAAWGNAWRASDPWSTKRLHTVPPPGFF